MEIFYNKSIEETERELNTNKEIGLSKTNFDERLNKYGANKLQHKKKRNTFQIFMDEFKNVLVIILLIAALISIGIREYVDGIVILVIVLLNALLGVIQEKKATNALQALKDMAAPSAKVIRDNNLIKVSSSEIVPGDIVILEAGDYVPADIRLIESINLKIDESALTGESVAVEKNANTIIKENSSLGDRINTVYMSTIVTYGRGKGIVISTGMNTEIGKIASMLNETKDNLTPLQKKLDDFGKKLSFACIGICVVIFILGLIRNMDLLSIFMTSISLAVAAIPEGLPAVVTVVLALGMQKMIKRNAIIKKLSAVETLGSTTVICTDKTGTLTQNKMVVKKVYDGERIFNVTGTGYSLNGEIKSETGENTSENLEKLMKIAVLCNDAILEKNKEEIIGDPTEGALIVLGTKGGYPQNRLQEEYPRLDEIPFDSERKLMSTLHNDKENDKFELFTKGAPDIIIDKCSYIKKSDKIVPIQKKDINEIKQINKMFADKALRVLGFAYKNLSEKKVDNEENDLIFIGLTGMIDPPREEAKDAIDLCKSAGIDVVMITGDHKLTASAIADEMGIISNKNQVMSGSEIDELNEEDLSIKVRDIRVFARVSPEHKVKIVNAIQANSEICSMTGDGVNDAPALKKADIGIAMGITGTDVAKEAADMVLTDDNFSSIVHAVEEGRIIYNNIRKFVGFLLSCNIGELLLIFIAMLFNLGTPLLPIQLLWINLITDSFPAFALGMESKEDGIMDTKPRDPNEPIANKSMKITIAFQSISLALTSLIAYIVGLNFPLDGNGNAELARTLCFVTLIVGEILRSYSARSEYESIFKMGVFSNKYLNYSAIGALILLFIVLYIPAIRPIFHTSFLHFKYLFISLLLSTIPFISGEVLKIYKKRK